MTREETAAALAVAASHAVKARRALVACLDTCPDSHWSAVVGGQALVIEISDMIKRLDRALLAQSLMEWEGDDGGGEPT